ncbi:DUF1810 domain-containing protein [Hymenobacter cheonanensis]|uniref:DUF1810 domain-containing protein n=1 Tax=Hymenobacter sp. CA2-7 TaxID=3063993 RepID=UPI0027141538|nr:DUF1810 domain-containing protein [Hymenobacter sp. CA2-7]MDO7884098.1 DUF1810 domain-containing protein [Hymenobacter sp. CA2-7]
MAADYTLQRFLDAQATDYPTALAELKAGRKRSHWMWYIFPQIQGLGFSAISKHYAIGDAAEAAAYARHPVLGPRLVEIATALLGLASRNATQVFGSPDDLKLRSSMTLFAAVPGASPVFQAVLDKFFGGTPDAQTLRRLR